MTEVKHWIGVGKVDKLIAKLEEFDKAYKWTLKKAKENEKIEKEFRKLGIIFGCEYDDDDYCLSARGAIIVLKALKKYNEEEQ